MGAVYGPISKDEYLRIEATARLGLRVFVNIPIFVEHFIRSARRGMWKDGTGESPAEYKARYRELEKAKANSATPVPKTGLTPSLGRIGRKLFSPTSRKS
jgi:hypothetical protein